MPYPARLHAAQSRFLARSRRGGAACVTTWRANSAAPGGPAAGTQAAIYPATSSCPAPILTSQQLPQ
jgi:hypothetical protein